MLKDPGRRDGDDGRRRGEEFGLPPDESFVEAGPPLAGPVPAKEEKAKERRVEAGAGESRSDEFEETEELLWMRLWRRRWLRTGDEGGSWRETVDDGFVGGDMTRTMVRVLDEERFGSRFMCAFLAHGSDAETEPRRAERRRCVDAGDTGADIIVHFIRSNFLF